MSARESQHHVVDFFSADSNNRGEMLEKDSPPFQQMLKPALPVALSLRTRESSALVCKQIFDQIYSSAESNPNNNNDRNSSLRVTDKNSSNFSVYKRDTVNTGGRHISNSQSWQGNSFTEEHRIIVSETETSFCKAQPLPFPAHNLAGASPAIVSHMSHTDHHPVQQQTSMPQVVARPSLANTLIKQPAAQLTIFYSGTVNVYDDVPADRANAIMLLAGTGNALPLKQSSEYIKELTPATLKSPMPPASLPLHMGPTSKAMGVAAIVNPASPSIGKAMGFSAPPAVKPLTSTVTTTVSLPATPSPAPSLSSEPKTQAGIKRPHTGIELPHARKASLARFLEKRKDSRVQVKPQPVEETSQNEDRVEKNNEDRPSSPKALLDRLPSPAIKQL